MAGWPSLMSRHYSVAPALEQFKVEDVCLRHKALPHDKNARVTFLTKTDDRMEYCPNYHPIPSFKRPLEHKPVHVVHADQFKSIIAEKREFPAVMIVGRGSLPWECISRYPRTVALTDVFNEYT